jgi:hypothetical protein
MLTEATVTVPVMAPVSLVALLRVAPMAGALPVYEPDPVALAAVVATVMSVEVTPFVRELTVYEVAVPSAVKATHALSVVTVPEPSPRLETVGTARVAVGVIATEAGDAVDVVPLPDAVTTKVYEVPLARPETVQVWFGLAAIAVVDETTHEKLPGVEVAVYEVAVASGVNVTLTAPLPAWATGG